MASVKSKTRRFRNCFVPHCETSIIRRPEIKYFPVPRTDLKARKSWFRACNRSVTDSLHTSYYCCEDHFDECKMVHSCCAFPCKEKSGKGITLTFHSFPKDPERRKLWETQLKRKNFKALEHSKICSKHFKPECFDDKKFGGTWLKPDAVPTIFEFPTQLEKKRSAKLPPKHGMDHKRLENDVVNMVQHNLTGCPLRLKDGVLPHIFDCQKTRNHVHSMKLNHSCENHQDKKTHCSSDIKKKSSLRKERAWIRERKKIVADLLRASTESKESNPVSEFEIASVSAVKVKKEVCDTASQTQPLDTKTEAIENVVIKEEPKSDSEVSESEESELNYVLDMVMQENKEHEENSCSYSSETNQDSAVPEFSLEFLNEDNEESILPDTPSVSGCEEMNSNESSTTSNETQTLQCQQPSRLSNWEGDYEFKIKVSCESSAKNTFSVYSDILKKLFISKDIGFRILVFAKNVPPGSKLRASAIFSHSNRDKDIVTRCPAHAQEDRLKGMKHYFHVVQSVTSQAVYEMDLATGQFSVVVPYEEPQEGELYTVYGYKLTCFNSCSSGINRRPFVILYTLEQNGIILGRYTVNVKVCACPTRELRLELLRFQSNSSNSKSEGENCDETKTYSLTVDDANLFKFLNQMKVLYESSDFVKCVTNMDK